MKFPHLFFSLSIILILYSCSEDTDCCPQPANSNAYETGIFVLNEGNFGSGNSTVSFIDEENGVQESQIFKSVNSVALGDTGQSIKLYEGLAIIVLNVSNKIELVNRYTFKSVGSIEANLSNPRYAEVINDKIYVSNWGDGMNASDDYIAVFDLSDFSFIEKIDVPEGPEALISANNKLFVAHKGGFTFNNIVSVIDATTNTLQAQIEVGDAPNSMALNENRLWVLSGGKPSYADTETAGKLSGININTNTVEEELEFNDVSSHPDHLVKNGGALYYNLGKEIYQYSTGNSELPEAAVLTVDEPAVLYGMQVNNSKLYVSSPNPDFTGNGKLYVYDLTNGILLKQYTVGVNPNGVYFNN
ncbi:YncE family protein [Christiangramia salexigens]|uniref:Cell surface protein n=1 Tax=Christiangramia salexigens TaxID=1913577 RepID=A0A1L3J3K1_9FLAO|nr:DUF5074 domain-containing protein [Christiangramia salexigens]APG59711.1 hypothetical protein LPB144_04465 [Christiangramia salexigens]